MAANNAARPPNNNSLLGWLRSVISDIRFLQILGQAVFLILVLLVLAQTANDINNALVANGINTNFDFLNNRAGFAIAGTEDYSPDDSYWQAFIVGLQNTLNIVVAGLIGATVVGILWGIFLLSSNWLIRTITRFIVEILRNTPLLVQIFAWFFVVILSLPAQNDPITFPSEGILLLPLRIALYVLLIIAAWRAVRRARPEQRQIRTLIFITILAAAVTLEIAYRLSPRAPDFLTLFAPEQAALRNQIITLVILNLGVIVGALSVKPPLRTILLGVFLGQIVGLILFFLGILPASGLRIETAPAVYLSNRGLVYPHLLTTARFGEWFLFVVIGITVAAILWVYLGRVAEQSGEPQPRVRYAVISIILFTVIGWFVVTGEPAPDTILIEGDEGLISVPLEEAREDDLLTPEQERQYSTLPILISTPQPRGLRFEGGATLDQRYLALLLALVFYTAAFIAEIVRAGILAVPHGQTEAARALGLNSGQVLRMVILPQALRVIIPPLGNQYLNLAKNSSLAFAISYADVFAVMNTVINQSGQSVAGILIIMVTYLIISLVIAAVMNWVNGRFQIVTR